MMEKTNVMRILDRNHISYKSYCYKDTNAISGIEVVEVLHENPEQVLKTLVTISKEKKIYVFMIPVAAELDLKKAAKSVSVKALEMLKRFTRHNRLCARWMFTDWDEKRFSSGDCKTSRKI